MNFTRISTGLFCLLSNTSGSRSPRVTRINVATMSTELAMALVWSSPVPRLFPAPVFDRLQYAKTAGDGLYYLYYLYYQERIRTGG